MNRLVLIFIATAGVLAMTNANASSVSAKLMVSPQAVLRGLPAAFTVTITNTSPGPQTIVDYAALHVTDNTESFVASFADQDSFEFPESAKCPAPAVSNGCIVLAPGASTAVYFDFTSRLDVNPFFMDARLSQPGQYTLQMELLVDHLSAGVERILSSPASLTIVEPTGEDAAFWARVMQQGRGGSTWSSAAWTNVGPIVASAAYAVPTNNGYTPWLAGLVRGTPSTVVAAYDRALGATPPTALRDALLMGKARVLDQASRNALWGDFDVDGCIQYADLARKTLNQLVGVTTVSVVMDEAQSLLSQLFTPATANEALKSHLAAEPPAPLHVQPSVACVRRGDGNSFSAVFSYVNPNKAGKVILIGNENEVTPAPRDQGQPRVFRPGSQANVFSAVSPGGELKWHLDGNVATATAEFPTQCIEPLAPAAR